MGKLTPEEIDGIKRMITNPLIVIDPKIPLLEMRPTKSISLHMQMFGRALRPRFHWLNWYINRGHISAKASRREQRKFMRMISHRRKF